MCSYFPIASSIYITAVQNVNGVVAQRDMKYGEW
jgi:hypothetical protein